MSSGERPIGAAKGKQTDTMASCQTPPTLQSPLGVSIDICRVVRIETASPPPPPPPARLPPRAWGVCLDVVWLDGTTITNRAHVCEQVGESPFLKWLPSPRGPAAQFNKRQLHVARRWCCRAGVPFRSCLCCAATRGAQSKSLLWAYCRRFAFRCPHYDNLIYPIPSTHRRIGSRAPGRCPATVPLTPSARLNAICNRQ